MNERIQVLEEAIKILETDGWCQGQMKNEQGHYCLKGAVRKARSNLGFVGEDPVWLIHNQLKVEGSMAGTVHYNDYIAKDKRYVIRLLRRTINANSQG